MTIGFDHEAVRTFPHRRAGHCGSGALRDLLELHQLDFGRGPLSEGAVFGLAGGLGFLYLELPEMVPPIYLVGRTSDLERDIAPHLGLGLEFRDTDDPEEGWRWVREEIDAGRPPMVWADIAELEYLRVRMSNTRHDIVLVDYDDETETVLVADNDRDELQRCSSSALRDPRAAVDAALDRAIANMRSGGEPLAGLAGGSGLDGVDRFATTYGSWPARLGDKLDAALSGLRVFIVKAGTGGAMFRSLHAEFLHDMAELLDDPRLSEAAGVYDELTAAWVELAGCAERREHAEGASAVARIAELEHAGVAAMEAARA